MVGTGNSKDAPATLATTKYRRDIGTIEGDHEGMRELDEALFRHWDQDPIFQALVPGGMHRSLVPTDVIFPYITLEPGLSGPVQYTTGPHNCQDIFRLFHIWDTDDTNVERLMEKTEDKFVEDLPSLMHPDRLILAGYIESTLIAEDPDKTGSGLTVWQGTLNVRYLTQRR